MTRPAGTMAAQRVILCALAVTALLDVGCVSRHTYDRAKAETLEQTQALEAVREEVRELDREIAELQASNRREDAAMSELRATIQREEEQLPIMRQRAEDTLASLKTQVATLMNQSWHLARKIVDIRHESVSLQAKVAQYKEEMEQAQSSAFMASRGNRSSITQAAVIEPPLSMVPTDVPEASPQIAQVNPTPPPVKPTAPSPTVKVDPPSTNDSWIAMISNWFSKIWNWLFG
jgi:septal ring factor EnvC (AmiA/AmiB activator)